VCQLDSLKRCVKLSALRQKLRSLPKTLDATYERILCNIREDHKDDAVRIFQWLVYSEKSLTMQDVVEILATSVENGFDPKEQIPDPRDILEICSCLITISKIGNLKPGNEYTADYSTEEVKLAHFSVKEYLVSDRISKSDAAFYAVREDAAQNHLAQTCLSYLRQFKEDNPIAEQVPIDFSFGRYSALHWTEHARKASEIDDNTMALAIALLEDSRGSYINWLRLVSLSRPRSKYNHESPCGLPSPLYCMSELGVAGLVRKLLEKGADPNTQCARGCALEVALRGGHTDVVRLLIKARADVNAPHESGGKGVLVTVGSALGSIEGVKMLLEAGADVNSSAGSFGSPLQTALHFEQDEMVRFLLKAGADVNAHGGYYGNALAAAVCMRRKDIAQLLLDSGADVNAQVDQRGGALIAAISTKRKDFVQLILDAGAEVNAQGGFHGSALIAAVGTKRKDIIQLLLESGADVNARVDKHDSALIAAVYAGDKDIVQLLLDSGADVNAQDEYGSALQAALGQERLDIAEVLVQAGAVDL
jgi:ankyrin repeat protein